MDETMTCPRRMADTGVRGRDVWQTRWIPADSIRGRIRKQRTRLSNAFNTWKLNHRRESKGWRERRPSSRWMNRVGFRSDNTDLWPGPNVPRSCSYCGSLDPEDAIRLVREGWHVGVTDKNYKRYLDPPKPNRFPVPPVKLYLHHFDDSHVARFNAALKERSEKAAA